MNAIPTVSAVRIIATLDCEVALFHFYASYDLANFVAQT